MSVLLAENFKNLLIKKYPQYTLSFNNLKQIYKRTHILPIDDTKVFAIKKRNNVVETFRDYTQKILPEMEKSIEMNLLKNRFEQIKDQKAKDSILQAYQKRSLTRYAYSKLTPDFQYYPPDVSPAEIIEPKNVFMYAFILNFQFQFSYLLEK